jgi:hypothetical protein
VSRLERHKLAAVAGGQQADHSLVFDRHQATADPGGQGKGGRAVAPVLLVQVTGLFMDASSRLYCTIQANGSVPCPEGSRAMSRWELAPGFASGSVSTARVEPQR